MKVLLTGGAGFIGSHVAEQLVSHGYEVVIIDNLASSSKTYLPEGIKFYEMDINDFTVESIFKSEKPDIVIHLAAQTSVVHSMKEPYFDFQTNTAATVKLLQYAAENGVRQFVFASSAAVYGEPVYLPIDEHHSVDPQSFYAISKYAAELYITAFGKQHDITPTILRFSNVYGPRQNTSGEAGVVGILILKLLQKENCIIYGGKQTRDFVFVKDVAIACAKAVIENKGGIFNISSNTELAISELYKSVSEKMSIDGEAFFHPYREGELVRSVLSNEKAGKELVWKPNYSISKGLDETIEHYIHRYTGSI
ncbi:NAD-dependent epimerase/dehydratase family protein [Sporosarcina luteola]|uniref:NAD-dependent epimerase/dehydratase family protein n=1 Tax=Sporosarcina luteola TaxID=582850 RepID=UPI00203C6223|nr:NAD-dependent epimerase/dehydratase family protein [Sporosarcina luteola]MCM3711641.1 NAD-dependent epimerase/dehydratase family protein [Sporosarcina luteola]